MNGPKPYLVDTHTHLDDRQFDDDRASVIERMATHRTHTVLMSIHPANMDTVLALAQKHQFHCAVGVHPNAADRADEGLDAIIRDKARAPGVVAVGEIGLDYYRDNVASSIQRQVLERQMALAEQLNLPVVLHNREATEDLFAIIKNFPNVRGVWHSFMGTAAQAEHFLALGYYLGIGGPITFNKNADLRGTVKGLPLNRLLLETDCPYLTPAPHRGKRNEPSYVIHVAEKLAELKERSVDEIAEQTTRNAMRLFQF